MSFHFRELGTILPKLGLTAEDLGRKELRETVGEAIIATTNHPGCSRETLLHNFEQIGLSDAELIQEFFEAAVLSKTTRAGGMWINRLKEHYPEETRFALKSEAVLDKLAPVLLDVASIQSDLETLLTAFEVDAEGKLKVARPLVLHNIERGRVEWAKKTAKAFGIEEQLLFDAEYQDTVAQLIEEQLYKGGDPRRGALVGEDDLYLEPVRIREAWQRGLRRGLMDATSHSASLAVRANQLADPLAELARKDPRVQQCVVDLAIHRHAEFAKADLRPYGEDSDWMHRPSILCQLRDSPMGYGVFKEIDALVASADIPESMLGSSEELQKAVAKRLGYAIYRRDTEAVEHLIRTYRLTDEVLTSYPIQVMVASQWIETLKKGGPEALEEYCQKMGTCIPASETFLKHLSTLYLADGLGMQREVSEGERKQLVLDESSERKAAAIAYINSLRSSFSQINYQAPREDLLQLLGEELNPSDFPPAVASVIEVFELRDPRDFQHFCLSDPLMRALLKSPFQLPLGQPLAANSELFKLGASVPITNLDVECLIRAGVDLRELVERRDYKGITQQLLEHSTRFENAGVANQFAHACTDFDYQAMFRYVVNQDLHDAINGFSAVKKTFR